MPRSSSRTLGERLTFELARHKAWWFGARTERMKVVHRQMFEYTAEEDEGDLQAQLDALQGSRAQALPPAQIPKRQTRRQKLPEHLRRIEQPTAVGRVARLAAAGARSRA